MYLKFNLVRLDAHLLNGNHAIANIEFQDGCNVILTKFNTLGKSSIINSLAVALGFDELVKGNISALVNDTIKIEGIDQPIGSAVVYLQIQNEAGNFLSIKRKVRPDLSRGIATVRGPLTKWNDYLCEEYYLGPGSYKNKLGFHRALSEFIGFPEIKVVSHDDSEMNLYLEYIFSAIFIEQKRGWADFMSNRPYFRVREPKKSTVAEILGMNYIKNNLQRNKLKIEVEKLKTRYESNFETLKQYVNNRHFSLYGISNDVSSETWNPTILHSFEDQQNVSLTSLIADKLKLLSSVEDFPNSLKSNPELLKRVNETSKEIRKKFHQKNELDGLITSLGGAIKRYRQRIDDLELDLQNNKEEKKLKDLFKRDPWSKKQICPVCEQGIDESLLSQVRSFPTMSIDENIKYIREQKKLFEDILSVSNERKSNAIIESNRLEETINSLISEILEIQSSFSGSIPAEVMLKAREVAELEKEVEGLKEVSSISQNMLEKIKEIFDQYHLKNTSLKGIKLGLSNEDESLLKKFEDTFRSYLGKLGYNSYEIKSIFIDKVTFTPRVNIQYFTSKRNKRADFGSSASDWIRIITAYTLALHASRSNSSKSNHPNISIFDEPAQQRMNEEDHLELYTLVSKICKSGGQVIIAATDENNSIKLKAMSLGINVIDFGSNYILQKQV